MGWEPWTLALLAQEDRGFWNDIRRLMIRLNSEYDSLARGRMCCFVDTLPYLNGSTNESNRMEMDLLARIVISCGQDTEQSVARKDLGLGSRL